jgi:TolC family type I secretion outer membrane protein
MKFRIWLIFGLLFCQGVRASGLADPFSTEDMTSASPCSFTDRGASPLALADVVERALCNNPQTRSAWANAKAQAAQVGIAKSAYLPTLSASANSSENRDSSILSRLQGAGNSAYSQTSTTFSLSYLLYDFGARRAALDNAKDTLAALNATRDATIQSVFLSALNAYYQLFSSRASVDSALESEKSSLEAFNAAESRYKIGTATLADVLQAKTAYVQAALNRITSQGNEKTAEGVLANAMGMDANSTLVVLPPVAMPDKHFEQNVNRLIDEAKASRPDLKAAQAQVEAARANVDAARATGMPTVTLSAGRNITHSSIYDPYRNNSLAVSVNIPIFTGFNTTYQIRQAEARVEATSADLDKIVQQVSLDVWKAYYALVTATETLKSTQALFNSATQSEKVALGRYKAGVGTIIDLLTAESALASARQQRVQATYNWQIDKASLAQAVGELDEIPKKVE